MVSVYRNEAEKDNRIFAWIRDETTCYVLLCRLPLSFYLLLAVDRMVCLGRRMCGYASLASLNTIIIALLTSCSGIKPNHSSPELRSGSSKPPVFQVSAVVFGTLHLNCEKNNSFRVGHVFDKKDTIFH